MAVLNMSITIDDADLPRLMAACRDVFGNPDLTQEAVTEMLRQYGVQQMQQLVKNYERRLAVAAAENGAYTLGVS